MPRRNSGPRLRYLDKRACYYIVWTESGRSRERSTGTADRRDAEIALADFIRQRSRDDGPRDPNEVLVTDILIDYAEERGSATVARERVAYALLPLTKFWEGRTVASVTPESCKRYGQDRKRSDGTVRRELGVLRAAINHAHRAGRLTRAVFVGLPDSPGAKERWLTKAEAAALLRAAWQEPKVRLYLPLFILTGLYTGQRKEAILSLRWAQVDLEAGRINFNPPGRKQTNKRRPFVPIAPRLLPHLRRARRRGTDLGFVINRDGKRLADVKKGFAAACNRAGLEGVSPHTLRHTAATWLMQRGIAKWQAAAFLGMTEATLQKVYEHHHPEYLQDAARAFS